jgi:hypothetical protein
MVVWLRCDCASRGRTPLVKCGDEGAVGVSERVLKQTLERINLSFSDLLFLIFNDSESLLLHQSEQAKRVKDSVFNWL